MRKAVEIVLALTIIGVTLDFGGVQPLAYSLMEIAIFAVFAALIVWQARRGQIQLDVPLWPVLFALLVILQLIPLPQGWIASIDRLRLPSAAVAAIEHTAARALPISIYPHDTLLALIKFLAYLAAFVLAAYVFDSRQRGSLLVRTLIFLGLFEAAYGIVQYLADYQKIFTFKKINYIHSATGTYINHNHFAGFLELTFPFALGVTFYYFQIWRDGHRHGPGRVDSATANAAAVQSLIYAFLLIVSVVAVVFSGSRTGTLGTLCAIVAIGLLAQFKTRQKTWLLGLLAFVIIAVAYGLWIGLNPILTRFQMFEGGSQYFEHEGRLATWKSTYEIVRHHPLTGTGLGTFRYAFPHVQTYYLTLYYSHAHSDYLEFLSETGWLGAALLFIPILVLLILMVHAFLTDSRRYRPSVTLGCIGATLALLIHSVADFNLHIPANALIFAVILGIGYKAAWIERRSEGEKSAAHHPAVAGRVHRKSGVSSSSQGKSVRSQ